MATDMTVAKTIWQQLTGGNNKFKVMSWGCDTRKLVGDKNSLTIKVNARRHKGWVKITLNELDMYDVELIGKDCQVKQKIEGLYWDNLTESIDREIELIPSYKF